MALTQAETVEELEPQSGWFTILTKPGCELMVHKGLSRARYTTFYPFEARERRDKRTGKMRVENRPYYPGYVFLRMEPFKPFWPVRHAPGVLTVLFDERGPYRLPDDEIERLRALCDENGQLLPAEIPETLPARERYGRGTPVRIVQGPLIGFDGFVVKDDGPRIWVRVRPRAWGQGDWKTQLPEGAVQILTEV